MIVPATGCGNQRLTLSLIDILSDSANFVSMSLRQNQKPTVVCAAATLPAADDVLDRFTERLQAKVTGR
jgi:hypothetical protein